VKRLFDIVLAVVVLILFLPIGLFVAFAIKLDSKGPVFYKQKRVGYLGKDFFLHKFRSMRIDAEKSGQLTVGMKDVRITKPGYFIRKFKLDEFPQFINVLKGEMSVVGPRPEVREYVDLYSQDQLKVLNVRPGITDYASLLYFEENKLLGNSIDPKKTYVEEIMVAKLELNQKYIEDQSLWVDLKIIFKTFIKIFL
jgi:lipopolysaccharide/colanic/teichoic acid biosynthesis glycosyltransferase